eukprot:1785612-Rhodomonas_salina.2
MSGTGLAYAGSWLSDVRYGPSLGSTDLAKAGSFCYAVSGTGPAYAGIAFATGLARCSALSGTGLAHAPLPAYARATRCPLLT